MDIAIIGASGTIGRQIAISLVQEHVTSSSSRLQLVGRWGGASERILPALASDLSDAYAEIIPEIEVVFEPTEVRADIIIVAAGQTVSAKPAHLFLITICQNLSRDSLSSAAIALPLIQINKRASYTPRAAHGDNEM